MFDVQITTTDGEYSVDNVEEVNTLDKFLQLVDDSGTAHYFNMQHLIYVNVKEQQA